MKGGQCQAQRTCVKAIVMARATPRTQAHTPPHTRSHSKGLLIQPHPKWPHITHKPLSSCLLAHTADIRVPTPTSCVCGAAHVLARGTPAQVARTCDDGAQPAERPRADQCNVPRMHAGLECSMPGRVSTQFCACTRTRCGVAATAEGCANCSERRCHHNMSSTRWRQRLVRGKYMKYSTRRVHTRHRW